MQSAPEELPDGLQKSTVRRPPTEKYLQPQDGDKVVVHYVLSLEITGEVLDSSRARGNPFEFTVGAGEVIRGWEEATKLMRKGEVAKWTVAPSLAFGNDGDAGRGVPPASVVLLELEIVSCPQREDLFEDGAAIKLETKSGTGPVVSALADATHSLNLCWPAYRADISPRAQVIVVQPTCSPWMVRVLCSLVSLPLPFHYRFTSLSN